MIGDDYDNDNDVGVDSKGIGNHPDGNVHIKVDVDADADVEDGFVGLETQTRNDESQTGSGSRRILLLKTLVLDFGLSLIDLVTDLFQAGWLKLLIIFKTGSHLTP